jgi:hypothetical protein
MNNKATRTPNNTNINNESGPINIRVTPSYILISYARKFRDEKNNTTNKIEVLTKGIARSSIDNFSCNHSNGTMIIACNGHLFNIYDNKKEFNFIGLVNALGSGIDVEFDVPEAR